MLQLSHNLLNILILFRFQKRNKNLLIVFVVIFVNLVKKAIVIFFYSNLNYNFNLFRLLFSLDYLIRLSKNIFYTKILLLEEKKI